MSPLLLSPLTASLMHRLFLDASETTLALSANGLFWISRTNWESWEWVRDV